MLFVMPDDSMSHFLFFSFYNIPPPGQPFHRLSTLVMFLALLLLYMRSCVEEKKEYTLSWGWEWFVFFGDYNLEREHKTTLELTQERRWSFVINMLWTFICLFSFTHVFDWWTRLAGELFLIFMNPPGILLLFLGCQGRRRQEVIESYSSTHLTIIFLWVVSLFDGNRYPRLRYAVQL